MLWCAVRSRQAALFQQHLEPLVKARMATDEDLATVGLMQAPQTLARALFDSTHY